MPDTLREGAPSSFALAAGQRGAEGGGESDNDRAAAGVAVAGSPHGSGSTADSEAELQRSMDDANNAAEELLRVRARAESVRVDDAVERPPTNQAQSSTVPGYRVHPAGSAARVPACSQMGLM